MKQSEEIKAAVNVLLEQGKKDELYDLFRAIEEFSREPGINIFEIHQQIALASYQVQDYNPELERLLCKCKYLKP